MANVEYRVRSGDTLLAISRRYNVELEALSQANGIQEPARIWVGQVLRIPHGAGSSVSQALAAPEDALPKTGKTFLDSVAAYAIESQRVTRVPASVALAQAVVQSNWGSSLLSRQAHNYFGLKGEGPMGHVTMPIKELVHGQWVTVRTPFRKYKSVAQSFEDHGRFLVHNECYRKAFEYTADAERFAQEIGRAGYATDPPYALKLISLIREYQLERFDRIAGGAPAGDQRSAPGPGRMAGGEAPPVKGGEPTAATGSQSTTPPAQQGARESFDLTKLPDVMAAQKDSTTGEPWSRGPRLMRRWFAGPTSGSPPDTQTITMDWVLRYARAMACYEQIFQKRLYINASSHERTIELRKSIRKMCSPGGRVQLGKFGDLDKVHSDLKAGNTEAVNDNYINLLSCGGHTDPLDDLKAALGRWVFLIHVEGVVEESSTSDRGRFFTLRDYDYKTTITRVGVHVRDSFDFEGFQPLGCWNIPRKIVGNVTCEGGTLVYNSTFRDWRKKNHKGGDFLIYSDLRISSVPPRNNTFFFDADD